MPRFRAHTFTALVMLLIAFALMGANSSQTDSEKDVRVVNTTAEPVPVSVQGAATIGGTIQAQQSGPWNVGIMGMPDVRVGNAADAPVLVRDVDNPARQAFQRWFFNRLDVGQTFERQGFEIPAGKRLVIEFFTFVAASDDRFLVYIETTVGGETVRHRISLHQDSPGVTGSQPMRLYADGGTTLNIDVSRFEATFVAQPTSTISGHFVNMP